MKLYKINEKFYELKRSSSDVTTCGKCVLYETGKRRYCPSEKLLEKCSRLGWNAYFVEYNGNIEGMEVMELVEEKKVYKRIKKGFTRRDVLRELILELKEKLGVDIVRKCDSVEQCKDVINEIIKIACNCELSSAKDLIAIKDKTIKEIEKSFDDVTQINKDLNRGIVRKDTALKVQEDVRQNLYKQLNEKDEEIEKLKSEYDELRAIYQGDLSSYKEEVKNLNALLENTEQSRVEWLQKYKSVEKELSIFKSDNEILGMWLREAEDRGVLSLIAFKAKRMFNKIFGNGYDK